MGKSTVNSPFSMAMRNYQRVYNFSTETYSFGDAPLQEALSYIIPLIVDIWLNHIKSIEITMFGFIILNWHLAPFLWLRLAVKHL